VNILDLSFLAEILGSIAFAASGAVLGIKREMDVLGVFILAIVVTMGGGLIRDVVVGNMPPVGLSNPIYIEIAILTSVVVIIIYKRSTLEFAERLLFGMRFFDAIGLGVFTGIGLVTGLQFYPDKPFLAVTTAVLTACGGGVIRDVLAMRIPFILKEEVYALASIIGAVIGYLIYGYCGATGTLYISAIITMAIRFTCMKYNICLPNFKVTDVEIDVETKEEP
jgi:uncharacterized membrane protein YeiH